MTKYTIRLPFENQYVFAADMSQASATIYTVDGDGELLPTPYQTADARHDLREAAKLALCSDGRDYFATHDDERTDSDILDELVDGEEITEL